MTRLWVVALVAFLGACYTSAPLRRGEPVADIGGRSIAFATLTSSNSYKPAFRPNLVYALVARNDNGKRDGHSAKLEGAYRSDDVSSDFLISFLLEPGDWTVESIVAQAMVFPIQGTYTTQEVAKFMVPERRYVYFGHVDLDIVERTRDDQPPAGFVLPLIDQAVSGASGGTFVIRIEDRFDADVALARSVFGVPAGQDVLNATVTTPAPPAPAPAPAPAP